jgi:hypothetical protein
MLAPSALDQLAVQLTLPLLHEMLWLLVLVRVASSRIVPVPPDGVSAPEKLTVPDAVPDGPVMGPNDACPLNVHVPDSGLVPVGLPSIARFWALAFPLHNPVVRLMCVWTLFTLERSDATSNVIVYP